MILKGDCIEVMKAMKPNSVDAICTDPPYGLEFMGQKWDKLWDKREFGKTEYSKKSFTCSDGSTRKTNPVTRNLKNPNYKAGIEAQLWHSQWLTEAYRVLKPGGSMLVMGGTRTSHRLACAIEDSGFIIKDTLMWLYGSGFPKAQDLGKMIDKRFKRKPEYYELAEYLKNQRQLKKLNTNDIGKYFLSKSGGITGCYRNWEYGNNVPTREQWKKLKKILGLNDRFDWLIERETKRWEEAEREKIGEEKLTASIHHSIPGANHKERIRLNITSPTTDLAKHWDGFKVGGIKPAYEPIIWAVKPPEGSYVDNVLKWGVGAVNVDETRINGNKGKGVWGTSNKTINPDRKFNASPDMHDYKSEQNQKGRFPANIILSHHPECVQVGVKKIKSQSGGIGKTTAKSHFQRGEVKSGNFYANPDGLETVESWDCHPDCAVRLLDEQSGVLTSGASPSSRNADKFRGCYGEFKGQRETPSRDGNSGGASRFFYCAKASRGERNAGLEGMEEKAVHWSSGHQNPGSFQAKGKKKEMTNHHPTVKPIKLFEWLIKLVTREGQIILDPFIGSGTTAIAAHNTGRKSIGIEKEDEYLEIAKRRIGYWKSQPKQMEMRL